MKETKTMGYQAPQIETINARVERGFEMSSTEQNGLRSESTEGVTNSNNNYNNSLFS